MNANFTTDDLIDNLEDFLDDKPLNITLPGEVEQQPTIPNEEEEGEGEELPPEEEEEEEVEVPSACGFLSNNISIDYRRGGDNWCGECEAGDH